MLLLPTAMASANTTDLNGIGATQANTGAVEQTQPTQTTPTEGGTTAEALQAANEALGVTPEAMDTASSIMSPVAYWANIAFAVLLTFAFIAMFFITGIDLVYIAFPPIRGFLLPEQPQGGGMGMGMGGFGGGMGGMGGQPQQSSSKLGQWISDEAKAAVQSSQPQGGGMGGGGFGGGFGGGMGGGFGGGFGGGMGGSEPAKPKSVIMSYFKKRVVFLVLFGVCALLLSTTLFTDIGINIGTWIMNRLLGISDSIPE